MAEETGVSGALAGWRRSSTRHGCVLVLQVAASREDFAAHNLQRVTIALNDRQIRSLARDLGRAAAERGIELRPKRRRWLFW